MYGYIVSYTKRVTHTEPRYNFPNEKIMNMFEGGLYDSTLPYFLVTHECRHNFFVAHECRPFFEVCFMIMVLDNFVNELQASTIETTNLSGWSHNIPLYMKHNNVKWRDQIKEQTKFC